MTAQTVEATLFTKVTPPVHLVRALAMVYSLAEDVDVAEVAEEGVGEHVQQQTGTRRHDHLDQIPGAVAVEVAELEHLVSDCTAGDADDELQDEGGDGITRITGQDRPAPDRWRRPDRRKRRPAAARSER